MCTLDGSRRLAPTAALRGAAAPLASRHATRSALYRSVYKSIPRRARRLPAVLLYLTL